MTLDLALKELEQAIRDFDDINDKILIVDHKWIEDEREFYKAEGIESGMDEKSAELYAQEMIRKFIEIDDMFGWKGAY